MLVVNSSELFREESMRTCKFCETVHLPSSENVPHLVFNNFSNVLCSSHCLFWLLTSAHVKQVIGSCLRRSPLHVDSLDCGIILLFVFAVRGSFQLLYLK